MSTLGGLQEPQREWETPAAKPLDQAAWQAWIAKGRAQDRRRSDARARAVKWVLIAGLLAAAGFWSHLTPYAIVVRSIVAAGAIAVMLQAFHARRYAFAAVFAALTLLYNPVAPVFSFSGDWQRALLIASTIPFVAALAWPNCRPAHHE